uniref:Uncharacterized protein n=1 Tax=Amphimedon queenslandica TaxID=400682 RepID=A0A1X7THD2_AMPQE
MEAVQGPSSGPSIIKIDGGEQSNSPERQELYSPINPSPINVASHDHLPKRRKLLSELESVCDCSRDDVIILSSDSDSDTEMRNKKVLKKEIVEEETKEAKEYQFTDSGATIYEVPSKSYTGERILEILLDDEIDRKKVCEEQPTLITKSATFVIDINSLKHPDDVKKDEFGRCHPSNSQLTRLLAFVTDPHGDPHHLCLLSYRIPRGYKPVVQPHGNLKSLSPFYPTLHSTKQEMRRLCTTISPKGTVGVVSASLGGVVAAKSPCQLPRNECQVMYIKSKHQQSTSSVDASSDHLFAVMLSAKSQDENGKFVCDTRPCPEPAFIVARD